MTSCRAAASLAAPQRREENVPVMILTPSRVMRRLASLAAAVGSVASATANTSFLPMTPPRSLMRSRTISRPSTWRLPSKASGPVIGSRTPILYSPEVACPPTGASSPPNAMVRATTASKKTKRDIRASWSGKTFRGDGRGCSTGPREVSRRRPPHEPAHREDPRDERDHVERNGEEPGERAHDELADLGPEHQRARAGGWVPAPRAPAGDGKPRHQERGGRQKRERRRSSERPAHPQHRQRQRDGVAAAEEQAQRKDRDHPARAAERPVRQGNHIAGGQEEHGAGERGQQADDERASPIVWHCRAQNSWFRLGDVSDNPVLTPSTMSFCPLCGATLAVEAVPPDHREQKVCTRCRFVFYLNTKVVAATIPEQDGAILLTRRSINPGSGLWTFPGGFVDL